MGIIYHCISLSVDYATLGISSNNLQNARNDQYIKGQEDGL